LPCAFNRSCRKNTRIRLRVVGCSNNACIEHGRIVCRAERVAVVLDPRVQDCVGRRVVLAAGRVSATCFLACPATSPAKRQHQLLHERQLARRRRLEGHHARRVSQECAAAQPP
jgi:hypothetical protein